MSHELICSWLGLPPDGWPPDHYRLLGLEPGESDPERIEQRVHERLEMVRRYQLIHPEQVTEAMNRLAQAFVCLTDPKAKREYDTALLGKPPAGEEPEAVGGSEAQEPFGWLLRPEPPRGAERSVATPPPPVLARTDIPSLPEEPPPEVSPVPPTASTPAQGPPPAVAPANSPPPLPPLPTLPRASLPPPIPPPPPVDPVVEAATTSKAARKGLGTKRALYNRIAQTRKLLWAWEQAGKYLSNPKRRLTKPAEATELIRQLTTIRTVLPEFPALLGEAGQPGYLVVTLARQQVIVPTFQTLLPSQRQKLAEDCRLGQRLLTAHRQFLRQQAQALRKKSAVGLAILATRAFLDRPAGILILLGLLAINVALWKSYISTDWLHRDRPAPTSAPTPHSEPPRR